MPCQSQAICRDVVQPVIRLSGITLDSLIRDIPCFRGTLCRSVPFSAPGETILPGFSAFRCCPLVPIDQWTFTLRTFRESIAQLSCSLCTLRARLATDDATLANGWLPAFTVSSSRTTEFLQSISASFNTSFDYGLFTALPGSGTHCN
mgnify:CR=1